jgi:all-trans-8'-apo-beta-carotenal 15,15'-oxygenase
MACQIVECPHLANERKAGKALYASGQTRGRWRHMLGARSKSPRNINILAHGQSVYALAEGGLPIPLNDTLESGAPHAFLPGQQTFHAHYRVDPKDGTVYGFGIDYGRRCTLTIYRLPVRGKAESVAQVPLPGIRVMVHDIAFAGDALIVLVHPMSLRLAPLLAGLSSTFEALDWRPQEGSEVIVVPLANPQAVRRFTDPAFFSFHFGNAFRDGDGWQVDLVRMPDLDVLKAFTVSEMRRAGVCVPDPSRFGRLTIRGDVTTWGESDDAVTEFPSVNPRTAGQRHRYTWACRGAHNAGVLARLDHETAAWVYPELGHEIYAGNAWRFHGPQRHL